MNKIVLNLQLEHRKIVADETGKTIDYCINNGESQKPVNILLLGSDKLLQHLA